jgi:hypothetical protein
VARKDGRWEGGNKERYGESGEGGVLRAKKRGKVCLDK